VRCQPAPLAGRSCLPPLVYTPCGGAGRLVLCCVLLRGRLVLCCILLRDRLVLSFVCMEGGGRLLTRVVRARERAAGRDQHVFSTDLRTLDSCCLFRTRDPVLKLVLTPDCGVWVSMTNADIELWQVDGVLQVSSSSLLFSCSPRSSWAHAPRGPGRPCWVSWPTHLA